MSSGVTRIMRRVSGFIVVSAIMSASFSPRPFDRWSVNFLSPIICRIFTRSFSS